MTMYRNSMFYIAFQTTIPVYFRVIDCLYTKYTRFGCFFCQHRTADLFFSKKNQVSLELTSIDEHPGPPLSHNTTGSVAGLDWD